LFSNSNLPRLANQANKKKRKQGANFIIIFLISRSLDRCQVANKQTSKQNVTRICGGAGMRNAIFHFDLSPQLNNNLLFSFFRENTISFEPLPKRARWGEVEKLILGHVRSLAGVCAYV
jgi:hypothetical protein